MKRNSNVIIFILLGIIVCLSTALILVVYSNNENNEKNYYSDKDEQYNKNEIVIEDNKYDVNDKMEIEKNQDYEESNDLDVVNYFQKMNITNGETLKMGFIKIVDFLFYDEPVNGKRFSELTDEVKLKLLGIALSIDSKIDYYFPNYKETITNGTKRIYTDIKVKVTELYIEITTKICSKKSELCEDAKKDFESLKKSFGLTFDFLKEFTNDELNKLKDWYENFKEV